MLSRSQAELIINPKVTTQLIDYCNTNNIDLLDWYEWMIHIVTERHKLQTNIYGIYNGKN